MLELILLWGYMLFVNASIGVGVLKLLYSSLGKREKIRLMPAVIAGIVAISTYAGLFSIFYKVGMVSHLFLLAAAICFAAVYKKELKDLAGPYMGDCFSWKGVFYFLIVLMIAFFASRGELHTDTGIYHAQAIRWYEEYGLVKGLGNLQQHFAYNSSYLGYAAIFSMKWLLGRSLHGTNGFLQAIMCVWALWGLKDLKKHENNLVDACRIGILIYTLVNVERIMSPATDFATMYMVLYIITSWAQLCCEKRKTAQLEDYALLCVAAVCVTTFKLSAGMLVLLAIYPAILLIRKKLWKNIAVCLLCGVAVLIPFLVRNVLISGWLVYPLASIDLFHVDWKIPVEYLEKDSAQIKVWGRCLFDVEKLDLPLREWFPVWWNAKDSYEKMLIGANFVAVVLEFVTIFYHLWHRKKINWELVVLHLAVFGGIVGWFVTAPFIRYGLAFLLEFPLLSVGSWLKRVEIGPVKILAGICCTVCFFFLCYYWSYYFRFDMYWIKDHLKDPAYVRQQDYDVVEVGQFEMNGVTIYYPLKSDNISYHAFPATAYETMGRRTGLRGDTLEEGFRAETMD